MRVHRPKVGPRNWAAPGKCVKSQRRESGLCPRPVHIVVLPNGGHLLNAVNMLNGSALPA